jgi:hypothetical protein
LKTKLFDDKLNSFEDLFHIESTNDEQQQQKKNDLVQFLSTPIQDFQQLIKLHFDQIRKFQSKQQISSPINNHYQRGSLLSRTNGDSVSSSSGVGSIGIGQTSSSRILSNGVSPSGTNREDYYPKNEVELVVENLRALESIFAESLSNVQRNLEEMLQMNQQQQNENPYTVLTRQTSAPPLGQRSVSTIPYPSPSLLATYSNTNSGGSSNGNNSRSTTPFSDRTQNSTIDINLNSLSQASSIRRTDQSLQVRAKFGSRTTKISI